jgi:hypothetical protein
MADAYTMKKDAMRREGQDESAARFKEMAGGVGSIGLPSRTGEPRRPAPEVVAPPPVPPVPKAGFYQGAGEYEYIVGPRGEITIANSKFKRGIGNVVEVGDAFYDDIAEELANKTPSTVPDQVRDRLKMAQASKAAPRANAVADTENVVIESSMTSAAPAPMPMMAGTTYGSAQPAATQSSKVPPPPSQTPGRGQRALSDEIGVALDTLRSPSTPGGMGSPERNSNRTASGEASKVLGDYRSGVQLESNARSVIDGLVRNKMDPQAARALVDGLRAQGAAGAEALRSLAGGLFDERIMVATGRK